MLIIVPKSHRKWITFFAIVFLGFNGFSQEFCSQLINEEGKTIAYAKVINLNTQNGVYSDRHGNFCIDYLFLSDSIVIHSGGEYETLNLTLDDLPIDEVLLTKAKSISNYIQDSVLAKENFVLNELSNFNETSLSLMEGETISCFINESENYSGRIQSIIFYLNDYTNDYLIIPALYEYDIMTSSVGKKISLKNYQLDSIIINDWNEMKILDTVFLPQHGFYVGFDCIPRNRKISPNDSIQKSSISFGAYHQKIKEGNRTYFISSKDFSKWFQLPQNENDKKHILNLAVKIEIDGNVSSLQSTSRKFVKQKKMKKLLEKSKLADIELPQRTIRDLYSSLVRVLETKDVLKLNSLIKIEEENIKTFENFINENENNLIFNQSHLSTWNNYLNELKSVDVIRIEKNYYSITFENLETHFLIYENGKWYLTEIRVGELELME